MLRIRDHGVDDYTALRNIGTTDVGVLRDDDRACLDEIGHFLVLHDEWHRFAIWLLHKYFDPGLEKCLWNGSILPGARWRPPRLRGR